MSVLNLKLVTLVVLVFGVGEICAQFKLEVVHLNDFHARFEETSIGSNECKDPLDGTCIGGIARVYTMVNELLADKDNAIFLNAGDNFQGTLWYNIFRGNVTWHFLNLFKIDVYTIGNHEFDHGVSGVVPFLQNMKAPMIVSNMVDTEEPEIQGLYNKSTVIERQGRKIGVVGVIWQGTASIANTGKLQFTDEVQAVNQEAARLVAEEGVNIVIVLSHCGLDVDIIIAENAGPHIGLIVGGHSHSLMYTGTPPSHNSEGIPDTPVADYPLEVTSTNGQRVLIVQASAYTKYLGDITVDYDDEGNVVGWEGVPIFLDNPIVKDPYITTLMEPWKLSVDAIGKEEVGFTKVDLDASKCRYAECNFGNFLTDAFVHNYVVNNDEPEYWTYASIAFTNPGGIRTSIPHGSITLFGLVGAQPFENTIDVGEIQGKYIKEILELAATSNKYSRASNVNFMSISGIHVTYDLRNPEGSRVTELLIRCQKCLVPSYEAIDLEAMYRIITPSFLTGGGDGFTMIKDNIQNVKIGPVDQDVLREYLKRESPVTHEEGGRITVLGQEEIQFDPKMVPVN